MTGAEMMTIYPGSGTRHEGHADQLVSTSAAAPAALLAPNAAGMVTGPSSIRVRRPTALSSASIAKVLAECGERRMKPGDLADCMKACGLRPSSY